MSISLESWEGVVSTVQRFYSQDLKPYYNDEYLEICLNVIGLGIGSASFNYVLTIVSLPEPICVHNNVVVVSLPMMQNLLDRHIVFPENKLENVKNFDIFKDFNMFKKNDADHYDNCVNDYMVRWTDQLLTNNGFERITSSQKISMVILFRLVLCVAHWLQHYKLKTGSNNHDRFHDVEVADLKRKFDDFTSLKNNSETAKRFKKLYSENSTVEDYVNSKPAHSTDDCDSDDDDGSVTGDDERLDDRAHAADGYRDDGSDRDYDSYDDDDDDDGDRRVVDRNKKSGILKFIKKYKKR
ncbi:unnamed protein product [Macrosiphum euphorbiae]|uniref:Uncharacterized protein n=1 Tax=Macrosiphum euphorbiae TaxID=13131 RepID=A0AAV0Y234_9HEMI|nr:unnamed protein product [Macrosiphum euphorbiae]